LNEGENEGINAGLEVEIFGIYTEIGIGIQNAFLEVTVRKVEQMKLITTDRIRAKFTEHKRKLQFYPRYFIRR